MPYDPNFPTENTLADAAQVRAQFNSLKALIDALAEQMPPIGSVRAWCKNKPNTPPLSAHWAECNGQVLNDPESPYDGQVIENVNGGSFLRGALASGGTGGADSHTHDVDLSGTSAGDPGSSGGSTVPWGTYTTTVASILPAYCDVVFVMRIK